MANEIAKGIDLVEDVPGEGAAAARGCSVVYSARFFLRKGDEVTLPVDPARQPGAE